jgi:hypothetical protein
MTMRSQAGVGQGKGGRAAKKLTLHLLASLLALTTPSVRAQNPISIRISPSHDGVSAGTGAEKAGSPVYLLVELRNDSGKTLTSSQWDYEEYYTFDVRDAEGKTAPEKDALRWLQERLKPGARNSGHGIISRIEPGITWKEQLTISDYFDMSRPGTYTIQLERKLPDELGTGTIKLDKVTVTVAESNPAPAQQ